MSLTLRWRDFMATDLFFRQLVFILLGSLYPANTRSFIIGVTLRSLVPQMVSVLLLQSLDTSLLSRNRGAGLTAMKL